MNTRQHIQRHPRRRTPRRTLTTTALVTASALAALTAATGCSSKGTSADGEPDKDGTFTVGYSQANNAEPYRAQLNKQLTYFIKKYPNLKLLPIADANQNSATQISQVQTFVKKKVDVLIVSPNEPDPLTPAVQRACDAKIPVIVLDRDVKTDCYTSFIGGDNHEIGKRAGERAVKALPDGGNVAELRGVLSAKPQIERHQGFLSALRKNPKIKVVKQREAKWLRKNATEITQQWLQGGTKIDLVYGHNDDMAIGARLAAQGKGKAKDMKFIGIDGLAIDGGGIRAVQQGDLLASFVYPTGAEEAARTVHDIVTKKKVKKKQILGTEEITKDNAAEMFRKYDFSKKTG
ncbi:substrate-binding domain-containing protein [Streptomyces sp. NPDC005438]|uniref:substrate-binding domain-containing protein n=1 Tax=Streptomyces sp. NPDC005438 TaxID=3156880 RepID=UPI00339F3672